MSAWDRYEEYIKAGGQNALIRETHLVDHIVDLQHRINEFEAAQAEAGWRVFDKNDESTWPVEKTAYWAAFSTTTDLIQLKWHGSDRYWGYVSHRMPIDAPSPPSSSETGIKKQ